MNIDFDKFNTIFIEEHYKINCIYKLAKHYGFTEEEIENTLDYLEYGKQNIRTDEWFKNKIIILNKVYQFNKENISLLI